MSLKTSIPAMLLLCLAPLAQAGKTPATTTYYEAPAGAPGLDAVDFTITVDSDPGRPGAVFWSNQFDLAGAAHGYTGMMRAGTGKGGFVFSVWNATDSKPGTDGSQCKSFIEGGAGNTCTILRDWKAGHAYQFHLAYEGDGWLGVTINDLSDKSSFKLGSLKTPAQKISPRNMMGWTEYFEWSDSRSTCLGQPYSKATFAIPVGVADGRPVQIGIGGVNTGKACPSDFSHDTRAADASVQENAIGNSARGALGNGGLCLEAKGGLSDGATPITSACNGGASQSWVWARDQSLQLQSDYCLEENGSGVEVRTCSGASGWDLSGGQMRSKQSGLCLSANRAGQRPSLLQCSDAVSQTWSSPTR